MLNIIIILEHSRIQDYSLNKYSLFRKFLFCTSLFKRWGVLCISNPII